jgi:hypothetical protein
MTVSLAMMLARSGAMMGNLIFPLLLRAGCAPPFFSVGSVILGTMIFLDQYFAQLVFCRLCFSSTLTPKY